MTPRFLSILVLSCVFGAASLLTPAQADSACIGRCFSTFSPSICSGCSQLRDNCLQQCNSYGAIAYSPATGIFGWEFAPTREAAELGALDECRRELRKQREGQDDCETPDSWFQKPWCGSIAKAGDGNYAIRTGPTGQEASMKALAACRAYGWSNCVIPKEMPQCAE
jgi:hypothetical protein